MEIEFAASPRQPLESQDSGRRIIVPAQQGNLQQQHRAVTLYGVCLAKSRQEMGSGPIAQEKAVQTLAAAWTTNMAFAGAGLGQWPSAGRQEFKEAGRKVQTDRVVFARALELNENLERTLITRELPQRIERAAPPEHPKPASATQAGGQEEPGGTGSRDPVVRPQPTSPPEPVVRPRLPSQDTGSRTDSGRGFERW